jgi:hypothetical protein
MAKLAAVGVLVFNLCNASHAAVITQWNFNVNPGGTNNSPVPSTGTGTAQMVGMNGNAPNGDFPSASSGIGSSDPVGSPADLSWRVRGSVSNGWSGSVSLLSGAQFKASTVGYTNIGATLDINATDGSPRYAQLQVTTDGSNFTSFGSLLDFNPTNDNWANNISFDFSTLPAASNNPNFGFKVVSAFSPFDFTDAGGFHPANTAFQRADADPLEGPYNGTAGNYRFDMVTFSGTAVPEPSTALLAAYGLASAVALTRRRSVNVAQ